MDAATTTNSHCSGWLCLGPRDLRGCFLGENAKMTLSGKIAGQQENKIDACCIQIAWLSLCVL